ncbi:MAG: FKBP-type peptidyl-prolyl cis-trans isomerase [Candidatus Diapherotrites archaeon]|nr:FKBP-type peptidyl-prolyl cis-trans isomerase [Candidatus Diapherotrites archaeon]
MNKKMVKINFTGRELTTQSIFDTTIEKEAKEAEIFDEKRKYGGITVILGEKEMLPLVEKELETMKNGEERVVKIGPKDGFGERKTDLVRVMPILDFQKQKLNPFPGMLIRAEQYIGKVQSVSGGRVRVDFNHPLAGRELEYRIKLEEEVKGKEKICEEIFEKYYSMVPGAKKEIKDESLYITIPSPLYKNLEGVNKSVETLGKEMGIKISFAEGKEKPAEAKKDEGKTKKEKASEKKSRNKKLLGKEPKKEKKAEEEKGEK